MANSYGDLKIDAELADIASDVAEEFYGQTYASTKTMGEEAVLMWLLLRVQPIAADTVDDVLGEAGYDDLDDLIDDIQAGHEQAMERGHGAELFDPNSLRAIHRMSTDAVDGGD